jgi:hypothetical protein
MLEPFIFVNHFVRKRGYKDLLLEAVPGAARVAADNAVKVKAGEAKERLKGQQTYDLIVLDGNASEAYLLGAIEAASARLNPGGVIAVDGAMPDRQAETDGEAWRVAWRLASAGVEGASVYTAGVGGGWLVIDFQAPRLRTLNKPVAFTDEATFAAFAANRRGAANWQGFSQELAEPAKRKPAAPATAATIAEAATINDNHHETSQPEPSAQGGDGDQAESPADAVETKPSSRRKAQDGAEQGAVGDGQPQP